MADRKRSDGDKPDGRSSRNSAKRGRGPPHGSDCILVIEDNAMNMRLFRDLLRAHGYQVLEARDGRSGIDLARAESPDLILLDLQLPDISGLTVAAELKGDERTHEIPIVVVTASMPAEAEAEVLATGCDAFLTKPIAIPQFRTTVASLLKGRRQRSKREPTA